MTVTDLDGVGLTSLWIAASRALESEREGAWFHDPYARALAGELGFDVLARADATTPVKIPVLEVRTRWLDEQIHDARTRGFDQIALLAAGMDARAFRLDALAGATLYELDRDFVLAYKREKLGDAKPKCTRIEVPVDLRDDWSKAITSAGFDPSKKTLWLVEGLIVYLEEADVRTLFARIDALSASASELLFDANNRAILTSPFMTARLAFVASLGAPWRFGTDEPEKIMPVTWDTTVTDFGVVGKSYGRWDLPVFPRAVANIPMSFLVRATKR